MATVDTPISARRSTGAAQSSVRSALLYFEHSWTWYRRNWRSSVVSSVLQPVLFLVALGYGFGSQVAAGPATLGLPYVEYLAPALLISSAVQTAAFESTYPILSSFKWQQTYLAVAATPVTAAQLVGGQLLWISARLTTSGVAFLIAATLFGAVAGPGAILAVLVGVLTGMAFAAPVVAYSATIESEGQQFNAIFRFLVMPMTMFAGTFFPVDQLPVWVQPLVWLTPVWHGTELARDVTLGGLDLLPAVGHLAFLLVLFGVGAWFAKRNFERRLAV